MGAWFINWRRMGPGSKAGARSRSTVPLWLEKRKQATTPAIKARPANPTATDATSIDTFSECSVQTSLAVMVHYYSRKNPLPHRRGAESTEKTVHCQPLRLCGEACNCLFPQPASARQFLH